MRNCRKNEKRNTISNIVFNDTMKEEVSLEVSIICYTDDTQVITAEDNVTILTRKVNTALKDITALNRVSQTESSNYGDGSSALYTPLSVQSPLFLPKGGADKALYSPKVFGIRVRWKTNFQGACQVDSSRSWKGCREHKPVHVEWGFELG